MLPSTAITLLLSALLLTSLGVSQDSGWPKSQRILENVYIHTQTATCKKGRQQKPQSNKHEAEATKIEVDFQAEKRGYIKTTISGYESILLAYFPPGLQCLVLPEWKY